MLQVVSQEQVQQRTLTDLIHSHTGLVISLQQDLSYRAFVSFFLVNSRKVPIQNSMIIVQCTSVGCADCLTQLVDQCQTVIVSGLSPKYLHHKHFQKHLKLHAFADSLHNGFAEVEFLAERLFEVL